MNISASLYSHKDTSVEVLAQKLDSYQVDYFHIDCLDDPHVFADIERIRTVSQTPIDLHLITDRPAFYHDLLIAHQVEWVCYQYEELEDASQIAGDYPWKQGLAIVSDTPIEVFDAFHDSCSFVLFMATTPGKSGGQFHPNTFQRIQRFRQRYPGIRIHVDGGVNAEVSFILRNMAVSTIISGSYLFKGESIPSSLLRLKTAKTESMYRVQDFMIGLEGTPRIEVEHATVLDALHKIEDYLHGLVIVVDQYQTLVGLITNADVRKGLIRHAADFNQMSLQAIINPTPFTVFADQTITELLEQVRSFPYSVHYLPVINRRRQVVGLLTFRDLVKGE